MEDKKANYKCRNCGAKGTNLLFKGEGFWNETLQKWDMMVDVSEAYCYKCDKKLLPQVEIEE